MTWAAILTAVASLLIHHPTPVYCHAPPGAPWSGTVAGWTYYQPRPHIYLRYCRGTMRLNEMPGEVYAHELLHVEHPGWRHPRIYATQRWYWRHVVRHQLARKIKHS